MKTFKTKISEKAFKASGFTLEEYLLWCNKHNLPPYKTNTKRTFFKKINEYSIIKIKGKVLEEGKEL